MSQRHFVPSWVLVGLCLDAQFAWANDQYIVINTWGSPGSNPGEFNVPFSVLTDPLLPPSIYVTDGFNGRIQKFDTQGNVLLIIPTVNTFVTPNQPANPAGLTQFNGTLYAVYNDVGFVQEFKESDGSPLSIIPANLTIGAPTFNLPTGAAVDNLGFVYVVDQLNYQVQKFDPTTRLEVAKWGSPCDLSLPNGSPLPGGVTNSCSTPAGGSLGDGQFALPGTITFAIADGSFRPTLYVTDQGNSRVEAFDTSGNFLFQFGTQGSANGQFLNPGGIADEWHCAPGMSPPACRNLIFVSDNGNGRVEVFDTAGNFVGKFGLPAPPGGATPGTFNEPIGIGVPVNFPLDTLIYVSDRGANTVQQFEPMPDDDNDGILNIIDTDPANFSNDYDDGAGNTGSIIDRGGQAGFNMVISKDLSNKGAYSGNVRVTTDPLGGVNPAIFKRCGLPVTDSIAAGSSVLFKCGSSTTAVEIGKDSVNFSGGNGTTVAADLTAGQSLKIDPAAGTVAALTGNVVVVVDGNAVSLAAGQVLPLPPTPGISVTTPLDGATLADFELKLFVAPRRGYCREADLKPRIAISPKAPVSAQVVVSYSNLGGAADGTIVLTDNGVQIGTAALTGFRGTGSSTIPATLGSGAHLLLATLSLANASGSSATSSNPVHATVVDAIPRIDQLNVDAAGVSKLHYSGDLSYTLSAGGHELAEGDLGASAASFTPVALAVSNGQTLCLSEHVHVKFDRATPASFSVSATANGVTHTESFPVQVYGWWHLPRWKISEGAADDCER
jgi:hypothetical protein